MKISIIIPIYPNFQFLNRTLDSLRKQKVKIHETICVLDGFIDKNKETELKHIYQDLNIRFIHHSINKGTLQARLTGCRYITGDVVTFIDDDDEIEGDIYNTSINLMKETNADVIGFNFPNKLVKFDGICKNNRQCVWLFHHKHLHKHNSINSYIFRSDLIKKAIRDLDIPNDLFLTYKEDILMLAGLFCNANIIVENWKIGDYIYHHDNKDSTTSQKNLSYIEQGKIVDDFIEKYLSERKMTIKDIGYKENKEGIPLYSGILPILQR